MPELFDVVSLTHPISEDADGFWYLNTGESFCEGAKGTVVEVYGKHEAYEVEFMDGEETIALVTLYPNDLRLAKRDASPEVGRRDGRLTHS